MLNSEEKLKKVEASGGSPAVICNASVFGARGGTWNRDGDILFGNHADNPIYRVSAAGGTPVAVTRLDAARKQRSHQWPYFLPDGRHFLYLGGDPYAPPESGINGIFAASLDSKETKFLVKANSGAAYASGYLLFLRGTTLMAQKFDPHRLELAGDAFPLTDEVLFDDFRLKGEFSVSENGIMAAPVTETGGSLEIGVPRQLFKVDDYHLTPIFDVTPDGRRFIVTTFDDQASASITLVINWPALLRKQ